MEAQIQEVHELARTHDVLQLRLPQLPERVLGQCQEQLEAFLELADLGLLDEWNDGDRALLMALRQMAGLSAKLGFLEDLSRQGITETLSSLRTRQRKHARKAQKYRRPKHQHVQLSDRDLDLGFEAKASKLRARADQLDKQLDRMANFHAYETFELENDPEMWWVQFTGKRPSRLMPKLRAWYDRNPSAQPRLDRPSASKAVARAAATWDHEDGGYLS